MNFTKGEVFSRNINVKKWCVYHASDRGITVCEVSERRKSNVDTKNYSSVVNPPLKDVYFRARGLNFSPKPKRLVMADGSKSSSER